MPDEPANSDDAAPDNDPGAGLTRPIPVVYFNSATGYANEFDLTLDLAYRTGGGDPEIAIRAVTTWEQAKSLRDLLDRMISRYEGTVGTIREFEDTNRGE